MPDEPKVHVPSCRIVTCDPLPADCTCDGYHTFDELYEHRHTLFIALAKMVNTEDEQVKTMHAFKEGFAFDPNGWIRQVWRSKLHHDGTMYDGWFVMGINKEAGKQISYHLPLSRWDDTNFAETLQQAPEFDGHTPADVLDRLKTI